MTSPTYFKRAGNALGVVLGDGWYHQSQLMEGGGIYGDPLPAAAAGNYL